MKTINKNDVLDLILGLNEMEQNASTALILALADHYINLMDDMEDAERAMEAYYVQEKKIQKSS